MPPKETISATTLAKTCAFLKSMYDSLEEELQPFDIQRLISLLPNVPGNINRILSIMTKQGIIKIAKGNRYVKSKYCWVNKKIEPNQQMAIALIRNANEQTNNNHKKLSKKIHTAVINQQPNLKGQILAKIKEIDDATKKLKEQKKALMLTYEIL